MSVVLDPDTLDRFQVTVDGPGEIVSLRGLGAVLHAIDSTGDTDGTATFTDAGADFISTDGIDAGDVLAIISDPANDGGIIGHYRVVTRTATTLVVDRNITASTAADLDYAVHSPETTGGTPEALADGVAMQALYSFLKEEYRTLAAGLGNAVDLNRFDFPFQSISSAAGQYIMGGVNGDAASAWTFAAENGVESTDTEGIPVELIRAGGWQERNAADVVLKEYANYTTLGTLDSDAQAYFQQGDATGEPTNFKLLGVVDQAVLTFGPDVAPADTTNLAFAATTITRTAGDWTTDNYRLGDYITIRTAEDDPANIGSFGPITAITSTIITIASASFTVNAADTTAIVQVDHRRYTALRARKKGRTYPIAVHIDAGIADGANILALINKFPLSHANDPATNIADNGYDDGVLSGGDGTAVGDLFQEVETHTTASDGAIPASVAADGTFTFTSAGGGFETLARTIIVLRAGDSLEITSGTYQGVYEIQAVTSDTVLNLYAEPGRTYPGVETTLDFTLRTGVLDTGHATNGVLADVTTVTGTLSSATSTFDVDTAIGDRIVAAGDYVELISGTGAHVGFYKVISRDSAIQLTLDTTDQVFTAQTDWSYRVWRPGMFLQRFESSATIASATNIDFGNDSPDTLLRTGGSWITDGFTDGMALTVLAAEDAGNLQTMIIDTVVALTITLIAEEVVTDNVADTVASVNGNITGDSGIVRTINSIVYPFHWRVFANGGALSDVFQFLQHQLRREYDIDGGAGSERGDITDALMNFISPNGTMLDTFPDDLAGADLNNVTYQDISDDARNNAFLVGLTFQVNANLISSAFSRLTAYFTALPGAGDDFGENGAVIIDDKDGVDMDFTAIGADIPATFDYTNNAQGGRAPDTPAGFTVVALGDDLAQHIIVTGTIAKVNSQTIVVGPALERSYSNP